MPTKKEIATFISVLKYYDMYQPLNEYKVVCPFHDDKNASLQININNAFFFCYARCGAQGSSLELHKLFSKKYGKNINKNGGEKTDLQYALEIKEMAGKSSTIPIDVQEETTKISNLEGTRVSKQYYINLPTPNWYRPSNVESISEETLSCKRYMIKRKFSATSLKCAQAKPSLNNSYPIIFPLLENGIFRGYVMRTFNKEIEQERKYLYNKGFRRELTVAGEFGTKGVKYSNQAKLPITTDPFTVVVVEGYLDKIKANQLGIPNVVALLGWKATQTQLVKLKKAKIKKVICALDNDEAGRKGYKYLKLVQKTYGFKVVRLHYPKGVKDMGELQQGTEQSQAVLFQIRKHISKK